ncbi:MAG: YpdA family putative bacillithiol disulfide reductase, partial [Chitinophagales bacterium]
MYKTIEAVSCLFNNNTHKTQIGKMDTNSITTPIKTENTKPYDVVIIGGGPIGLACGIEAKKKGLNYVIIEKGCLVNSLYNYPVNMTFFSTSERLEIGNVPFVSHGDKPNRREALEYYRRVRSHWELNLHTYEKVTQVTPTSEANANYTVTTSKGNYVAKAVVVATGFYDLPNKLGVEGEDLPKVKHYFDEPHPYLEHKLAIVGAGNSAVDVALETYRRGADVTMIVRKPEIKPSVKYWVRPDIVNRIKEGSIKAYFESSVSKITSSKLHLNTPDGEVIIDNDFVFAMTGYLPDFSFLQQIGIELSTDGKQTPYYNPDTLESNVPNIYLAGVVCGGRITNTWFIENSRIHAEKIMKNLQERLSYASFLE